MDLKMNSKKVKEKSVEAPKKKKRSREEKEEVKSGITIEEWQERQRKNQVKDWYEYGSLPIISDYKIHNVYPIPYTHNAIHAAHGLSNIPDNMPIDSVHETIKKNEINTRLNHTSNDRPPKPSFLDFIAYCASMKLKQSEDAEKSVSHSNGHFEARFENACLDSDGSDSSDDENNNDDPEYEKIQSEINSIRNEKVEMMSWVDKSNTALSDKKSIDRIYESCDETAAVAIATYAEECMVGALLPFAKRHTSHCRNENCNLDDGKRPFEEAFSKWIIPSHEAIVESEFNSNDNDLQCFSCKNQSFPRLSLIAEMMETQNESFRDNNLNMETTEDMEIDRQLDAFLEGNDTGNVDESESYPIPKVIE